MKQRTRARIIKRRRPLQGAALEEAFLSAVSAHKHLLAPDFVLGAYADVLKCSSEEELIATVSQRLADLRAGKRVALLVDLKDL